jgi:chloramphenicol 3-O-phosphotransferase
MNLSILAVAGASKARLTLLHANCSWGKHESIDAVFQVHGATCFLALKLAGYWCKQESITSLQCKQQAMHNQIYQGKKRFASVLSAYSPWSFPSFKNVCIATGT